MDSPKSRMFLAFTLSLLAAAGLMVWLMIGGTARVRAAPLYLNVSGHITTDTIWTTANSPYVLTSDVIVDPGVTLTIQPGVVVQGQSNAELLVQGNLLAIGTATQPITFTSSTNSGPGQWQGLAFGGGVGNLEHVVVRYGASGNNSLGQKSNVTIIGVTQTVRIANSAILSGSYGGGLGDYGLYIANGRVTITNTRIAGHGSDANVDYGLYAIGHSALTLSGNTFANNAGYPVRVEADDLGGLSDNIFSGNGHELVRVGGGSVVAGSRMAAQTGLEGYRAEGTLSVPAGVTLTIEAGIKAMFPTGNELTVRGHLAAVGMVTQPITLTSVNDSGPGQWEGLVFDGGTGDLEHVVVRYGASDRNSQNIRSNVTIKDVTAGQVRIANSTVTRSSYGGSVSDYGVYIADSQATITGSHIVTNGADLTYDYGLYATGNSTLTITGNTFSGNAGWAARVSAGDVQDVYGNTFSGNGHDRVRVGGGNASTGAKMVVQPGLEGYEVYGGDLVVPTGVTLTVEPGVTVMAKAYELLVRGQLEAVGTATQPITFTSADDSGAGQWEGLVFYGGFGNLRHVTVRYGGQANSQGQKSNLTFKDASPYGAGARIASSQVLSSSDDGIYVDGGIVVISDTLIADSAKDGLHFNGVSVALDHATIQHNGGHGVYVAGGIIGLVCSTVYSNAGDGINASGSPVLMPFSSAIYDNGEMGLNNTTATTVTATYNYWGAANGPGGVGSGSGDEVSSKVEYDPWLPYAVCLADLSIAKSDAPDPVEAQSPLTYTIVVTNGGPGEASSVVVTDSLPTGVQFAEATATQGTCNQSGGDVVCSLGDVAHDAIVTVTVRVTPTAVGTLTNTAVVTGIYDPIGTNNAVVATTTCTYNGADHTLAPSSWSSTAGPGESAVYTHTLTNNGNVAQTFSLTATSSAGFAVTVNPTSVGPLPPLGGSTVITVTVEVPADAISGTVDTAVITATGAVGGVGTARDTTRVSVEGYAVYLPLVIKY